MKNFFSLIFPMLFGMIVLFEQSNAQVVIENIDSGTISLFPPSYLVRVGYFRVVVEEQSYNLDSCYTSFHGVVSEMVRNVTFFRDGALIRFQSEIPIPWLTTLGEIFNFPSQEKDTTIIEFFADIGTDSLPAIGSQIFMTLECSGFSLQHENIVTNVAQGPIINVDGFSTSIMLISQLENEISVVGENDALKIESSRVIEIYDTEGKIIWEGSGKAILPVSAGVYGYRDKETGFYNKVTVSK